MEDMVERLAKRVGSMEESKRQMVGARERSSQRKSGKKRRQMKVPARDRGNDAIAFGG